MSIPILDLTPLFEGDTDALARDFLRAYGETGSGFLSGPNQWPNLPDFRATLEAYNAAMCRLAHQLIRLAAQCLGEGPDALTQHFQPPTTWLRLLYYPSTDPAETDLITPLTGDKTPVHFGTFLRDELGAAYDAHKGETP